MVICLALFVLLGMWAGDSTSAFREHPVQSPTLFAVGPTPSDTGTFIDSRDGESYRWVRIGDQVWMVENLRYEVELGSVCWENDPDQCRERGRYYTWEAGRSAVPPGWHLPSDEEWKRLEATIGLAPDQLDLTGHRGQGTDAPAGRLKDPGAWPSEHEGRTLPMTGDTGFGARPLGVFAVDQFSHEGYAIWWSSTPDGDLAWIRVLRFFDNRIDRLTNDQSHFFTVRCVRDHQEES